MAKPVTTDELLEVIIDFRDVMVKKLEAHDHQFEEIRGKLLEHDRRFDEHDRRFDDHDRRFDAMDRRLGRLETRIEDIEKKIAS